MRRNYKNRSFNKTYRPRESNFGWLVFLILLVLLSPVFILAGGRYLSVPSQSRTEQAETNESSAPVASATPRAQAQTGRAAPATQASVIEWKPKIAFQDYDQEGTPDVERVAERVDWLMMKYGMEQKREQVRERGYQGLVLQYMTTFQIHGPGPYKDEDDECEDDYTPINHNPMWTKDFCEKVHSHESWFLHNSDGERLYNKSTNWDGTKIYDYLMNPASEGFRKFWVDQMKLQKDQDWDGFFLDNVAVNYEYLRKKADNQDGTIKEYDSNKDWQEAIRGHLQSMRQNFPDKTFWGNMIEAPRTDDSWDAYLDELDGFQDENFITGWVGLSEPSADEWEGILARAEKALARGKSVVLYGQGEEDDLDRMRYSLASYLLIAPLDNRATYRYTYHQQYEKLWWYPEYNFNLGLPKGERYQKDDTWVRDFQCARVTVDPRARTGTIEQRPCQP